MSPIGRAQSNPLIPTRIPGGSRRWHTGTQVNGYAATAPPPAVTSDLWCRAPGEMVAHLVGRGPDGELNAGSRCGHWPDNRFVAVPESRLDTDERCLRCLGEKPDVRRRQRRYRPERSS